MIFLLTILLHLQLITGSGVYQESEITYLQTANQSLITSIESDPIMAGVIYDQYSGVATQIVVIDDKEEP